MKKQSSYIYLLMPKEVNDARGVLDEDPSPAHITLLYIGKTSRKEFDAIVGRIAELPIDKISVSLSSIAMYFDTSGDVTVDAHYTKVAYMPCDVIPCSAGRAIGQAADIHNRLRMAATKSGVKKIAHRTGAFNPHLTLRYLYEAKNVSARTDKSMNKLAKSIANCEGALYSERSIYVDWGDSHTVRVDLANSQIYQERW